LACRGVNKCIQVGNLTKDPECRFLPSGGAVANVTIANSEVWKDKNTGQPQEKTEFHRLVFFNRLAEIAGEYLKKGAKIYIEGSLRTNKWTDQSGQDRYTTEIVVSELQMLGGNTSGSNQGGQQGGQQQSNQGQNQNQNQGQNQGQGKQQTAPQVTKVENNFDNFDDDIPFN